jgi:hypothetical protein
MPSIRIAKVFYEIRAQSEGLAGDLKSAERQMAKFTDYALKNPIAVAGALGVALLGIAAKATEMAERVDKAFRKVGALVPDLADNMKRAQQGIAELAVVSGKSQEQLLAEAETIAKNGVDGTTDLLNRLRVLQDLADAAGADVSALAGGLDQTLDVFGLAADKAGEVSAKLFAIGQGKAPIEDLFAALQAAAPSIRKAGLDFDLAAAALGTLLNQGLNAKQAGKELKAMAAEGSAGAERLKALAGTGLDTADALAKLAAADRLVRESLSRSAASVRQEFNNALLDLGTRTLPLVSAEMRGLVALFDRLQGRGGDITLNAKATTARVLGQELAAGHISPTNELDFDKVKRFADAIRDVRYGIMSSRVDLAALSKEELQQLQQAFEQFQRLKGPNTIDTGIVKRIQGLVDVKGAGGAGGAGSGTGGPTPEELKAIEERKQRYQDMLADLQKQQAALTATLIDDSLLATDRFVADMQAKLATLSAAERAALQPIIDQLVAGMQAATQLLRDAESMRVTATPLGGMRTGPVLGSDADAAKQAWDEATQAVEDYKRGVAAAETKHREAVQNAQLQTQAIEQAARGALQLAEAFGVVSANAAQAAEAAVQIGASVSQFSKMSAAGASFTDLLPSVLSIAGGLASLASSLFGESPEQKHAREVQQSNTEAILELSKTIGDFGGKLSNVAGGTVAGVGEAAKAAANTPFFGIIASKDLATLRAELGKLDLSMADLKEVASSLGISFAGAVPTAQELQQLLQAIAENQLATFSQSFTGQLEWLQGYFEVFDITDPLAQLQKLLDVFDDPKFGSPALRKALAGLDLSTPEGRAAAEKAVEALYKRLNLTPAQGGFTAADLGGLSPEEFRQALLDLEKRMQDIANGTASAQGDGSQFAVQRTITVAQADLLASLLTTDSYWNEQTARNTAAMVAALGASLPAGSIVPPATATSAGGAALAGSVTFEGGITITVNVPAGTDPNMIGGMISEELLAKLDAALGVRMRRRAVLRGVQVNY